MSVTNFTPLTELAFVAETEHGKVYGVPGTNSKDERIILLRTEPKQPQGKITMTLHSVDGAQGMIDVLRSCLTYQKPASSIESKKKVTI